MSAFISKQNAEILRFWLSKKKKWSYGVIADHFGISRSRVAGIVFRYRHPASERVSSPGRNNKSIIGTGFREQSYRPDYTTQNTRI